MIKHNLLATFRQLSKNPKFYILNIFGLSIGMAVFLLVYQYCSFEFSFDKFHAKASNLYRLNLVYTPDEGQEPYLGAAVFAGVGPAMKADFPQVEMTTRIATSYGGAILRYEDNFFKQENIRYAEPSAFDIFDIKLLEGNPEDALVDARTTIISEEVKEKLFGNESALGKTIELRNVSGTRSFLITGVYENVENTHIESSMYLSWRSQGLLQNHDLDVNWTWFDWVTYVRLQEGTEPGEIESRIPAFIDKYREAGRASNVLDFDLVPVSDIHLHSKVNQELGENGDYQSVVILMLIASLILIIAWVNYINLYTAKAIQRGKEVGIRKTLGSSRNQLRWQFFSEALVVNFLAVALSVFITYLVAPNLQVLTQMVFPLDFFQSASFWLLVVILWLISSLFSGLYPALVISRFPVLQVLKSVTQKNSGRVRRIIVVWQFMASAALMTFSIIVYVQIKAMNNQPLGIITENIIALNAPNFTGDNQLYAQKIESFKLRMLGVSGVEAVAYSSDVPGEQVGWRGSSFLLGEGSDEAESGLVFKATVAKEFADLYGIEVLAGRDFLRDSDSSNVIINQMALGLYGFNSPEEALNRQLVFPGIDTLQIIGVVADFYQESLREPIKPTAFFHISQETDMVSIKFRPQNFSEVLSETEKFFSDVFPGVPFQWNLLEDNLAQRHQTESSFLKSLNIFVLLSIVISVLGLVGLVSFNAQKRLKEIGIRKVLGSKVGHLVYLMFSDFARPIFIGNLIAWPLAYYFSGQWLEQFAFQISYLWWLPALILIASLFMAFSCSIFHVLKAAKVNPVQVLRTE